MPIRRCISPISVLPSGRSSWWLRWPAAPAGGRVVIQTRAPEHHALQAAARHSVEAFAAAELPHRGDGGAGPAYPPLVGLVRFVGVGATEAAAERRARRLAGRLRRGHRTG